MKYFRADITGRCAITRFFFHSFISFISHNIKFTPFTTKYKNKIIIIIIIITTICGRTYVIDDSNKIFLVQR